MEANDGVTPGLYSLSVLCLMLLCARVGWVEALTPRGFHPSQVLTPVSSLSSVPEKDLVVWSSPPEEVKEDEVMFHFYRNGRSKHDYNKPSTQFMLTLFKELQSKRKLFLSQSETPVTDTIRCFSGKHSWTKKKGKPVAEFQIPSLPLQEKLRTAEIRFFRHDQTSVRHDQTSVRPREMKLRVSVRQNGKLLQKVVVRERCVRQSQYDILDVTRLVHPWVSSQHGNISLSFRVSSRLERLMSLNAGPDRAIIVLYLEDSEFLAHMYSSFTEKDGRKDNLSAHFSTKARKKRSATKSPATPLAGQSSPRRRWSRPGKKENCQLHNFDVDFNTIGWGQWIIHPKKFNARFCFGTCPSPVDPKHKSTNHAMLQALMRMKKPNIAPVPCCVPTKLSPLSMMYFEYNEIVVRHHEDMIAEECGCR
ncbi:derriere protein-like [Physella acuta]|uniref:derriere protein-like n=1 Tax=Physella acuta TaxID=109671 RepID=UPI0027DE0CB1|nr:derriere protein-like [Physella acuta]